MIKDICRQGETKYVLVSTGRTYHLQRVAIKRAIVQHKKQIGTFHRYPRWRRKKPKRRRGTPKRLLRRVNITPTIINIYIDDVLNFKVLGTDTIWEHYEQATQDALGYKRRTENS